MQGERILRSPNKTQIDEMLKNGHTAEEVCNWLKMVQKNKRYQYSRLTITYYRKNFLNMTRSEISQKRTEMIALGNTRDANSLSVYESARDFVEAKTKETQEIEMMIQGHKEIVEEAKNAIKLIKEQTIDAEGKPVFVPRNYEVMEKMLGRLESARNSFIKSYQQSQEEQKRLNSTKTTININQVEKELDVVKNSMKRILLEIDPNKIGRFFEIYKEELSKVSGDKNSGIKIEINSQNNSETNINISTQLPSAEEINSQAPDLSNENTMESIIDLPAI